MAIDLGQLEQQYGLPDGLLSAVQNQESGGDPDAVSPKGAVGTFQFMPATAKQYGIDPTDPDQSAVGAARMYSDLSKKYNGDVPSMLAAYNWGQGNVDKHGIENAPAETQDYIQKITSRLPKGGTQYAQADTGNMTDAGDYKPATDLTKLSDAELDAQIAKMQGNNTPDLSHLSDAELDAQIAKLQGTQPQQPSFLGGMGQDIVNNIKQGASNLAVGVSDTNPNKGLTNDLWTAGQLAADTAKVAATPFADTVKAAYHQLPENWQNNINTAVGNINTAVGEGTTEAKEAFQNTDIGKGIIATAAQNPNATKFAENIASAYGNKALAENGINQSANIISKLKASDLGVGDLMKDASGNVPYGTTPRPVAIPDIDTITAVAKQRYDNASALGGQLKPSAVNDAIDAAKEKVGYQTEEGKLFSGDSPLTQTLNNLEKLRDKPISLNGLDEIDGKLRSDISKAMRTGDNETASGLMDIRDILRNVRNTAKPEDIVNPQAFNEWRAGDTLWAAKSKMQDMQNIVENAPLINPSNPSTAIKAGFKNLYLRLQKNSSGYNDAEIEAIKNAAKTGIVTGALKTMGSKLIAGAVGGTAGALGGIPGALGGIAAGEAVGYPMRAAANALQARRATAASNLVASRPSVLEALKIPSIPENDTKFAKGGAVQRKQTAFAKKLQETIGRKPSKGEIELAGYVGHGGVNRLLKQSDHAKEAHKMFPKDIVVKHKELFFNGKKPYTVGQIKGVLS